MAISDTRPEFTPYDEIAYPTFPISYTHPDRLATVGTHFGMRPAPVEHCRVLELGCSDGANLLSMAVTLPDSEFVGIDLAGRPIAHGKARAEALGLKNLTLRHLDLLEMAPDYGKFDYIIAHGLYAWVPSPVREQILAICNASLQPQGIAYVSYNTFPGCYSRVMVREMMLFHNRDFHDPQQQTQQAMALLKLLANSRTEPDIHTKVLQDEFERLSKRSKEGLYHDELGEVFQPLYFYQFMEHAQRHELQFLGEANFSEMHTGGLTPQAKEVLDKIPDDLILRGQYLDFMRGRSFRRTLLCHKEVPLDHTGKSVPVRSYYVSSQARPSSPAANCSPGAKETFTSGIGTELATADPLARALLWHLIESQPERIPFEKLLTEVERRARQGLGFVPTPNQDVASELTDFVWLIYSAGLLDLHVYVPPFTTQVSERPVASPLARLEARDGDVVSTLHHRSLCLGDSVQRGLVMLMDGTRDHDALRRDLLGLFESRALTLLEDGKLVDDMQTIEKRIADETENVLGGLARMAVLVKRTPTGSDGANILQGRTAFGPRGSAAHLYEVVQQEASLGMRNEERASSSAMRLRLEPSPHFAFLHDFLRSSEFNEASICRRVGMAGLNEFLSGDRTRATLSDESDGLGFLIRLFLFGEALGAKDLESVLPARALEAMKDLGLLVEHPADNARRCARMALYPVGGFFIVSDRWTTMEGNALDLPEDFVFPAITANTSQFIATLPWDPCESFLELCSGTGMAAFEAARHANHAWAVDITERSTQIAEFNRLLNGLDNVTAVQGDLYDGLGDLTFDRIVAHPPYMPVLNRAQVFYDGGVDGEQVTRRIVMGLPRYLRPRGRFYCLAQCSDRTGAPFEQRVRAWLGEEQSEFDVLVIVRTTQSPADAAMQYAVKSKGGGQVAHRMREALGDLGIQSMVYGWMIIQRREDPRPVFTSRRSAGPNSGRNEIAWLLKWETASVKPEFLEILAETHPVVAPSLELRTVHRMKEGDLQPEQFSLHTDYPFSVDCQVQPWAGFLFPQCDGKLTVRQLLEFCKQNNFVHPETPLTEFAKLLMVFIGGGFLEVEGFELPKKPTE